MTQKHIIALLLVLCTAWSSANISWLTQRHEHYLLHYTELDAGNISGYTGMLDRGTDRVTAFLNAPFRKDFDVFIYPTRNDLDTQWRKDWQMPDFKSECWMVASGVASKLDMISPVMWKQESCEHDYADTFKTQQLLNHELVHVYHGQMNASPDFSDVTGIDWFVEGLATYVSGQCDEGRLASVKKAIENNEVLPHLDDFWTGKLRYGLSGSVVMYIDKKFGREKLIQLLPFNRKDQILGSLGVTEDELTKGWREYISSL